MEMVRFARPLQCRAYDTLTLVASTETYSLPATFMDWYDLEDAITIAGQPIRQMLRGQVEQWRDAGFTPVGALSSCWYEAGVATTSPFARKIGFYPVPSAAGTAKLHFLRKPILLDASGMSGSTEYPDIPSDFHEAAVYFAVWKFYQRRKELPTKDINFLLQYYQSKLPELRSVTSERMRPGFMSSTPNCMPALLDAWDPID